MLQIASVAFAAASGTKNHLLDTDKAVKPLFLSDAARAAAISPAAPPIGEVWTGTAGDDWYVAGSQDDWLNGAGGSDTLVGGAGSDTLFGGKGADHLSSYFAPFTDGEDGNLLNGGAGDDTLNGTAGDHFEGGDGVDIFNVTLGGTAPIKADLSQLADGTVTVAGTTLSHLERGSIGLGAGSDRLLVGDLAIGVYGAEGDDLIVGGDAANSFDGGDGDDELRGGRGDDTLRAGEGADMLNGGAGADVLNAAGGAGGVRDVLLGGAGDDTVSGGYGDVMDGGEGYDRFEIADFGSTALKIDFGRMGEAGFEAAGRTLGGFEAGDILLSYGNDTLRAGDLELTVNGFDGDDLLRGGSRSLKAYGEDGSDTLIGGAADDTLQGGDGADVMHGGKGLDFIYDMDVADPDSMFGGAGDDFMIGGGVGDWLDGGAGRDETLYHSDSSYGETVDLSGTGADSIFLPDGVALVGFERITVIMGQGADRVVMGELDSTINGLAGDDTLLGGSGRDRLLGGDGDDILNGGADVDGASFASGVQGVSVDLRITTAQDTGQGLDLLVGIENLYGSGADDRLVGSDSANLIAGSYGDDVIKGLGGDDSLATGAGSDTLTGGKGQDRFTINASLFDAAVERGVITDLTAGETVDFTLTDADATTSEVNDAFLRVDAFSGQAGEATAFYDAARNATLIRLDLDGDAASDFDLVITGGDWTGYDSFVW